ncbi:hypothetical protein WK57_16200 [Burkholderia ubonensis]|uniref:Uncharacterized protein n=1 Tax=Burkholderia ubonensis TaxID=101571 RepID=A0AA40UWU6_9BURK|nr:hypothetical protein WK57_16200 [Burkholderia ubonensis]
MGYAPLKTVAVLGDNYFTTEQIARQIRTTIGNFYATPEVALVTALMNHAGKPPRSWAWWWEMSRAPEQLAKLDDDIVWYVTALVDGKPVLVPTSTSARRRSMRCWQGAPRGGGSACRAWESRHRRRMRRGWRT